MALVVSGNRTDTELIMKFLIISLCVCAASAAYTPFQPTRQVAKAFVKNVASPVASTVYEGAKDLYQGAQFVATAPVVAAKAVYNGAQAVASAPVYAAKSYSTGKEAAIIRSEADVNADGYNYYYETGNGISAQASGTLKKVDNADVLVSQGSYAYVAPDGTPVQLSYVADENGYQPKSDLLPVGPAIPDAIARSLEYILAHPAKPENY